MEPRNFTLEEFFPYYPNRLNTGIGKAATFALRYLIMKEAEDKNEDRCINNAKL